ncbi:hypothetical protein SAMN05421753_103263 [Planctomicrobium piriforme]|uniref:Uncharacterized protein n=2 Tax=Planctomicrobium piriforme TaxID=1576369 RepID=A0A1I3DIZ6_9PLAN|nr:hypothetical protein SAMN05421753_103263 [Planctomicrobium piriforme]
MTKRQIQMRLFLFLYGVILLVGIYDAIFKGGSIILCVSGVLLFLCAMFAFYGRGASTKNLCIETIRRKLPLPAKLQLMMKEGRWKHPGQEVLAAKIPFIRDPLTFLSSIESMLSNSGPLMRPDENENERFSEYRGSRISSRDLPWIDVEQVIFIICNERIGDDVGIALDYRTGINSPRVVGGDWHSRSGLQYREIAPSFDEFVELIGL